MSITMTTVILFAVFGVLLFLGVPISISIVASSIVTAMSTLSWDQITFITMQKMNSGVESFSLLAVPLFILAGNIMNNGGIAKRLVNFAQLFVGKIPGSMAQANILGNMLFGALSGSSVAAASAMGGCIALQEAGLSIPEDISVMGYDGIYLSRVMKPQLVTWQQNTRMLGRMAADKLVQMIEHPRVTLAEQIPVTGKLLEGGSVRSIE